MHGGDRRFFYVLSGGDDDPVLAAYWLADRYHQHPDAFLRLTPRDIFRHVDETVRMTKKTQRKG